jgi:hypothetical protein
MSMSRIIFSHRKQERFRAAMNGARYRVPLPRQTRHAPG